MTTLQPIVDKRKFNGSSPKLNKGKTCTIRVPRVLKDEVLSIVAAMAELDNNVQIVDKETYHLALSLLESSLLEKANYGGRIKQKVREAIELLKTS